MRSAKNCYILADFVFCPNEHVAINATHRNGTQTTVSISTFFEPYEEGCERMGYGA